MMDSHIHLFRDGFWRDGGARHLGGKTDVDAYRALMAAHGITGALVVCYEADGIDPDNNAYVRHLARTEGWISSLAFISALTPPDPAQLISLLDAGHVGIALYLPDADTAAAVARWPGEIWQELSMRRSLVSVNARPAATAVLINVIAAAPGARFLFSHLGLPGACEEATRAEAGARLAPMLTLTGADNVMVKLSGLYAIDPRPGHPGARPFVDLVMERFGPDRLCWGSDFSPALEHGSFADTFLHALIGQLEECAQAAVMGGNLRRFLSGNAL